MEIDQQHIAEPGLVVLDEETARAVMGVLQKQWATSGITTETRPPTARPTAADVVADGPRSACGSRQHPHSGGDPQHSRRQGQGPGGRGSGAAAA
ncbi:DUF6207 family protein [Streptomyces lavendofoliae]|uniref:DUF6207 family protein n=1 Tax=Streptomyces lavendofoliae TaxID=67314 RepID=UPI001E2CBA49|nr:DUF6207 family protein [Streptomyces lavendofoliae]